MKQLKVTENKRFLEYTDGTPFFYLGDTAWELFHRQTKAETEYYLSTRASQGFNAIQAVCLAEFEGLNIPNAYGRYPLKKNTEDKYDPTLPDTDGPYSYWDHVDFCVKAADKLGLFIAMLPTWGDKFNKMWGTGPEIFDAENAYIYMKWLAERYKDSTNIIWILGGDRPLKNENHLAIIRAMGKAIRDVSGNKQLISFHPTGSASSYDYLPKEPWLDFHMLQTGHDTNQFQTYKYIKKTADLASEKPVMDAESRYEDHPSCFTPATNNLWDAVDIRNASYWNAFSGACGQTYGNHCIWSMNTKIQDYFPYIWQVALFHEGAATIGYLKTLMESCPTNNRKDASEAIFQSETVNNHVAAFRGEDYLLAYLPQGLPVTIKLGILPGKALLVSWFNPRTGETKKECLIPNYSEAVFVPKSSGRGNDWVLLLQSKLI